MTAAAHTAQTSARPAQAEPDLFDQAELQAAHQAALYELEGDVVHAHVCVESVGADGMGCPVLVVELDNVGPGRHRVKARIPYPHARAAADATAARLRQVGHATVRSSLASSVLSLPHAQSITAVPASGPAPTH